MRVSVSRRGDRATVVAVVVSMSLALSACGRSHSAVPPTTSVKPAITSTLPPPTTAISASNTAILAAYRAEWAAFEHAEVDANPLDPMLAATMVNPLLHQVEGSLVADNQEGIIGRGPITLHPHVASATAISATVLDCAYSASFLIYKKTGKQVPPITGAGRVGVKATLVLDGPTWKVKRQTLTEGSCPAGY
jgi:hypothetical protein